MIHSETSQLLSPVIYNSQSNAVNMKWRLAHFGLDLASPEDYIKSSVCEITQEIEDIGAFAIFHFSISNSDSPAFNRARVSDHNLEFCPRRLRQHHLPRSDIAEVSVRFKACRGIGMMGFRTGLE